MKGDNQNDRLGTTLAGPGDVNGDGYADLLAAELGTKRVKLFYGNMGRIDSIPDMTWNSYFSVKTIGDINGDGNPEVVMGSDSITKLIIFWGGTLLDTIPDMILNLRDTTCQPIFDEVSLQDVSAGDLNGDGYGDLVISTGYLCTNKTYGRVQLFWGGPLLDTIPDWSRSVPTQQSPYRHSFGASAKVLANLNGDSFADLVVAQMGNAPDNTTGCLHIFLGGNPMDTIQDQILNAPPPMGDAVNSWGNVNISLGDLNTDTKTDFWVGGGSALLRLYYGGFPIDSMPAAIVDQIGDRPAPGGDFNQDGFTDLILGQPRASFLAGSVFIYLGSSIMNGIYDIAIHDFDLQGYVAEVFGLAVTNTGDMNGDGVDDFAASAKLGSDPFDVGEVFIFSGDSSISTGVKDGKTNLPRFFTLSQNYPNPFNSTTIISYTLLKRSRVQLEIFNITGEKIRTLIDGEKTAGVHEVTWDGKDSSWRAVSSGIYLYKLKVGEETLVKKMVLLK